MKAKELRIGNLFLFDGEKKHVGCHDLMVMDFVEDKTTYQPILLSHEVLLSFGFIQEKKDLYMQGWYILKYPFYIHIMQGSFVYCADAGTVVELKYVHQLQNLYFAITGEELETK